MKYLPLIVLCFSCLAFGSPLKYHDLNLTNNELVSKAIELLDNDPSYHAGRTQALHVIQDKTYRKKLIEYQDQIIGIIIYRPQKNTFYLYQIAFDEDIIKREQVYLLTRILMQTRCYKSRNSSVEGNLESVQYWRKKFRHGKKK